jgi:hypothetical protein
MRDSRSTVTSRGFRRRVPQRRGICPCTHSYARWRDGDGSSTIWWWIRAARQPRRQDGIEADLSRRLDELLAEHSDALHPYGRIPHLDRPGTSHHPERLGNTVPPNTQPD